ncbi:major facilitator superfamily domain-containing protein 8-like [Antedon mediterranea]|uniref:major facilitator superfamily domain-containing protein 8-like n=1 Tax=Antedon mediterranea TaxID=105859 RepID=UPI003AF6E5F1
MYFTIFFEAVGYSMVIPSIWPYLQVIYHEATTSMLGWIIASNSLATLIVAPICGVWANKYGSKVPLTVTLFLGIVASVTYAYLYLPKHNNHIYMLVSRVIQGASAGCIAITRTFVSAATTLEERTDATVHLMASQTMGFLLGPVLQTAFVPLGEEWIRWDAIKLRINMYTMPSILIALMALVNFLLIIYVFQDIHIADDPDDPDGEYEEETTEEYRSELVTCFYINLAYCGIMVTFSFTETLASPYAMHILGWSRSLAVRNISLIMALLAILGIGSVLLLKVLSSKLGDRIVFVVGMLILSSGVCFFIPFGRHHLKRPANITFDDEGGGCPWHYDWCSNTPNMVLPFFYLAMCMFAIGYSTSQVILYTMYSKILGPRPQGLYMGFFTGVGSVGKTIGPLFGTEVYVQHGVRWAFGSLSIFITSILILCVPLYSRLLPYHVRKKKKSKCTEELKLINKIK